MNRLWDTSHYNTEEEEEEEERNQKTKVFSPDLAYKIGMKVTNKQHGIVSQNWKEAGDSAGGLAHNSSQFGNTYMHLCTVNI